MAVSTKNKNNRLLDKSQHPKSSTSSNHHLTMDGPGDQRLFETWETWLKFPGWWWSALTFILRQFVGLDSQWSDYFSLMTWAHGWEIERSRAGTDLQNVMNLDGLSPGPKGRLDQSTLTCLQGGWTSSLISCQKGLILIKCI